MHPESSLLCRPPHAVDVGHSGAVSQYVCRMAPMPALPVSTPAAAISKRGCPIPSPRAASCLPEKALPCREEVCGGLSAVAVRARRENGPAGCLRLRHQEEGDAVLL